MGIKLVLGGIGKGSLFRRGRFFGVHNPLGSDLGKASDPFINSRTLSRLLRHSDLEVKTRATETLFQRIGSSPHKVLVLFASQAEVSPTIIAAIIKEISSRHEHSEKEYEWTDASYTNMAPTGRSIDTWDTYAVREEIFPILEVHRNNSVPILEGIGHSNPELEELVRGIFKELEIGHARIAQEINDQVKPTTIKVIIKQGKEEVDPDWLSSRGDPAHTSIMAIHKKIEI